MSAKLATLGFFTINLFWNKCYDVITSVCDVTNKVLSRDSNYIIDVDVSYYIIDVSCHQNLATVAFSWDKLL